MNPGNLNSLSADYKLPRFFPLRGLLHPFCPIYNLKTLTMKKFRAGMPWYLPFAFIISLFFLSSCDPEDDIDDVDLDLQLVADGFASPIGLVSVPDLLHDQILA